MFAVRPRLSALMGERVVEFDAKFDACCERENNAIFSMNSASFSMRLTALNSAC